VGNSYTDHDLLLLAFDSLEDLDSLLSDVNGKLGVCQEGLAVNGEPLAHVAGRFLDRTGGGSGLTGSPFGHLDVDEGEVKIASFSDRLLFGRGLDECETVIRGRHWGGGRRGPAGGRGGCRHNVCGNRVGRSLKRWERG
jgi:hypothetical protein